MKRIDIFDFVCVYQQTDYVNQISSHHDAIFLPCSMRTVHFIVTDGSDGFRLLLLAMSTVCTSTPCVSEYYMYE